MSSVTCPECDQKLRIGAHPRPNQRIVCTKCELSLNVVSLDPLVIDIALPVEKPKPKPKILEADCPNCEQIIRLRSNLHRGQQLGCPACHTDLEIVSLRPLELDLAVPDVGHRKQNRLHKLESRAQHRPERNQRN